MRPRIGDDGEFEEEVDAGYGIYEAGLLERIYQRGFLRSNWLRGVLRLARWLLIVMIVLGVIAGLILKPVAI
jgi:hypothetical protein